MKNKTERIIYEDHKLECTECGETNNAKVIERLFKKSGNKFTMSYRCDHCDKRQVVFLSGCGFYYFRPYIDFKRNRMIREGWVQKRFYKNSPCKQ